jgi:beta-N-acetylhexosaminidase
MFKKVILFSVFILVAVLAIFYFIFPKQSVQKEAGVLSDKIIKEKIGQMLLVGFRGTEAGQNSYIAKVIKELNLGGVILFDYDLPSKSFPRNILNPEQLKNLIKNLKSFSGQSLIVAVDAEGGAVNRLSPKYGFLDIPSAQELGEISDVKITEKFASLLAQEVSMLGFNVDFAPVVDLNVNPENPIIGALGRAFSSEPEKVVEQARIFINEFKKNNITAIIKHFPGHGSSANDSHKGMVDITGTYQEKELMPFRELIKGGEVNAVMTAHIINRSIDKDYPATLSPAFIEGILRKELGFKGVVFSDDMQMAAINNNYGFKDAIVRAINAGCDILIFSNNNQEYDESVPYRAVEIIFQAVKDKEISLQRIVESSERIATLKRDF